METSGAVDVVISISSGGGLPEDGVEGEGETGSSGGGECIR